MSGNPALDKIDELKASLQNADPAELRDKISICVQKGIGLLNAFKKHEGKGEWTSDFKDEFNKPFLSSKEQKAVEEAFARAPWILPGLKKVEAELNKAPTS